MRKAAESVTPVGLVSVESSILDCKIRPAGSLPGEFLALVKKNSKL
jgi:hypothetical protein